MSKSDKLVKKKTEACEKGDKNWQTSVKKRRTVKRHTKMWETSVKRHKNVNITKSHKLVKKKRNKLVKKKHKKQQTS